MRVCRVRDNDAAVADGAGDDDSAGNGIIINDDLEARRSVRSLTPSSA